MSFNLNKATIIGNVGRDPEVRSTQDGKEIINFSVATSESWRDKQSGEKKVKTEWHRVVIFAQPLVNILKDRLRKGAKVYVEGSIQTRRWVDQHGNERFTTEIMVYPYTGTVLHLDSSPNSHSYEPIPKDPTSMAPPVPHGEDMSKAIDDEIPF